MYEELRAEGLMVITVAIDRKEDARSWIERAAPTHPSLIDEDHLLGELYNMVNVPTVVWIDEEGRIARPNDVAFTTEKGGRYAGVSTAAQMDLLRQWVRGESEPVDHFDSYQPVLSRASEQARAHFGLGWWLHRVGRIEAAQEQFRIASALAPGDFMIRRGTMPLRGSDPFGEEFREMVTEWLATGNSYYLPLPVD